MCWARERAWSCAPVWRSRTGEEDGLVAAEEVGTRAGGNVEQGDPREGKVPPQPAGGHGKGAHGVMAAVHAISIIALRCKEWQWRRYTYPVPSTQYPVLSTWYPVTQKQVQFRVSRQWPEP